MEQDYIVLDGKRYKVVARTERLDKGVRPKRTIGGMDFDMGRTYRVLTMNLRIPAEVSDPNYGTYSDFQATYAKNAILQMTDHDGTAYNVVIASSANVNLLTTHIVGSNAYFIVRFDVVIL